MKEDQSKVATVLAHPVTQGIITGATLAVTFVAGFAFGRSKGQKQALEEAGLPTAK